MMYSIQRQRVSIILGVVACVSISVVLFLSREYWYIAQLYSSSKERQRQAAEVLGLIGSRAAIPHVLQKLNENGNCEDIKRSLGRKGWERLLVNLDQDFWFKTCVDILGRQKGPASYVRANSGEVDECWQYLLFAKLGCDVSACEDMLDVVADRSEKEMHRIVALNAIEERCSCSREVFSELLGVLESQKDKTSVCWIDHRAEVSLMALARVSAFRTAFRESGRKPECTVRAHGISLGSFADLCTSEGMLLLSTGVLSIAGVDVRLFVFDVDGYPESISETVSDVIVVVDSQFEQHSRVDCDGMSGWSPYKVEAVGGGVVRVAWYRREQKDRTTDLLIANDGRLKLSIVR